MKKEAYLKYDDVLIGQNVTIGHGSIIYPNVEIGDDTVIGPYSTIGEPSYSFYTQDSAIVEKHEFKKTTIGPHSVIRSHAIIYEDVTIGEGFQSGHRITIREHSWLGKKCSAGTLTDIQGIVSIGNYVRMHSNVHIGQHATIEDYVWIYPYVVLTNDLHPPVYHPRGVKIKEYAVISASSVILPGIVIGKNALVGAHSVVTKDVDDEMLVFGSPAKVRCSVRDIRDENGNQIYPWKDHLKDYR
ncbi:MAG: N-acetyltransferase [Deltaproteobacteria bacterium]|nr:N-acetyltransferase [Deltaproteobacteria bacterium]